MEQFVEFAGNHPVLITLWLGLFVALVISTVSSLLSPVRQASPTQATLLINKQDGVVVDIRPDKEYRQGHILNAVQLPFDKAAKGDFASLEKYRGKPIIVACTAGISAGRIAKLLVKAGFEPVYVLQGGMTAWQSAGLPVVK